MENGHFYYINDQYFLDFPDVMKIEKSFWINKNLKQVCTEYKLAFFIATLAN